MHPDLELVQIRQGEAFKAWTHGYPFHTVRWHFHPEYEIHHVVETRGNYFVGDFIGEFEPGNLVLTGPNLPHNWVSDVAPDAEIPLRCRIVQFSESFVEETTRALPEFAAAAPLLASSRRGVLFSPDTAAAAGPILAEMVEASGFRRLSLFMALMDVLTAAEDARPLTSADYLPDPSGFMSGGINEALAFINRHLTEEFSERDLAAISGRSPSTFSRAFRRHTGMTLVSYVNRLRINLACQLLTSDPTRAITDICFAAGYNNVSNFNRQFLLQKGMTPTRFRNLSQRNQTLSYAA
ncbi:AraC family transcriptional regulator [Aureimonas sp. Leaf324]|uniref:AraC family transcriptional regulator n=1 Tax=Aureimonas sp. Leaf324 TaxID=1736336 RepID=UPI0006FBC185|nr:AraC family transcriptional regulator [Aureimonas sp. Leaf324]KQQ79779.1 AraC family transcriptional regulator [Aureimonas sp. Leaf324]